MRPGAAPADARPAGRPADAAPVGIGVPGMLDRQERLLLSPNLADAQGVDWRELMRSRLAGRRVVIENDANLAVLAEHRLGAAQGYHHVVMVTLGTGIGGGVIVDGRVQVGANGFCGEIGHMVVDPAGPPCPCGRRGCWERFASGGGLGLLAREAALAGTLPGVVALAGGDPEGVRGEDVTAAALSGDRDARRVLEQVGWWVGFGLANLASVLDPECFVIGGGLASAGDLLLDCRPPGLSGAGPGWVGPPASGDRPGPVRRARRCGGCRVGGASRGAVGNGTGVIRTGIVLPIFRETPDDAFEAAHRAFAAGVDGVFCYDHLWPLGEPDRPALAPFPVLSSPGRLSRRSAGPGRRPVLRDVGGPGGAGAQRRPAGPVRRPRAPGPGARHRRSGHR